LEPDSKLLTRWHNTDLLLIGGSAGSFKILFNLVRVLPAELNKAVVIIMHRKKNFISELEKLFGTNTRMKIREISDKDELNINTIYIAPANYHTLIENGGHFGLDVFDAPWFSKPSIDVTFETAAENYKERCAAILLSGANPDGSAGMLKLRNAGALTIAQNPDEAEMPEMPLSAIKIKAADYILNTSEIFELLKS
jgi:two-component system chemotaxis response regulator CheB